MTSPNATGFPSFKQNMAIRYNRRQSYPRDTLKKLQWEVGTKVDGIIGPKTVTAIAGWQRDAGLEPDGMIGPATRTALAMVWRKERILTRDEVLELAWPSLDHESGGRVDAVNRDGEWRGYFDGPRRDPDTRVKLTPSQRAKLRAKLHADGELAASGYTSHWASRFAPDGSPRPGTHIGLSLGTHQMTQDGGALGEWLELFWRLYPDVVTEHLTDASARIVSMLAAQGRTRRVVKGQGPGRRSPRVRQIHGPSGEGKDLWEQPWLGAMQALARTPQAQEVTDENLLRLYAYKTLELAFSLGFTNQSECAVALDIAIQYGGGGARRRMRDAAGEGILTMNALLDELPPRRRRRRELVYNRSQWWVEYTSLAVGQDS